MTQRAFSGAGIAVLLLGLSIVVPQSRADVLFNNGAAAGEANFCDQTAPGEQCNGSGFTIYDDFSLSSSSDVTGFTYNTYNASGSLATDYTGTSWSIWNCNPVTCFGSGPVDSGTTLGALSSGDAGSILVTIGGLNIDLAPGTYWLGTSNDEDVKTDITAYGFTNNGFTDASQSDAAGNLTETAITDAAFTIAGNVTATPEPFSIVLMSTLLLGVAIFARKRVAQA